MSVVAGIVSRGNPSFSFFVSFTLMREYEDKVGGNLTGWVPEQAGTGRLVDGRNNVVRKFLANTDAEWLLWIDDDMGFSYDALDRLLASADPAERPIVGGLCFAQKPGARNDRHARPYRWLPTIYAATGLGYEPVYDYPADSLVRCDATGSAFLLVHRRVYEHLRDHPPDGRHPIRHRERTWYDNDLLLVGDDGTFMSEDITFCKRATDAGYPIHVNTAVSTSHVKEHYLDPQYRPENLETTTVIIPAKNRQGMTSRLVRQLADQAGQDEIVVYDNGSDDPRMCNWLASQTEATVVEAEGWNLHQMWNDGIDRAATKSATSNVVILNNDLEIGDRFVANLVGALRSDPTLGAVSANYDNRQIDGIERTDEICAGRYDGTGGFAGFAFALRAEAGYRFPTECAWWYGDTDLLATIYRNGAWAGIVGDAHCVHIDGGGQTGKWDDPEMQEVLTADAAWFHTKWSLDAVDA
jgi:GT2 family glycosyltransferase